MALVLLEVDAGISATGRQRGEGRVGDRCLRLSARKLLNGRKGLAYACSRTAGGTPVLDCRKTVGVVNWPRTAGLATVMQRRAVAHGRSPWKRPGPPAVASPSASTRQAQRVTSATREEDIIALVRLDELVAPLDRLEPYLGELAAQRAQELLVLG